MQEALAYFLRSFGNAVGTAHKARLTRCFDPPLLLNTGFSVWGENMCSKQSKREPFLDTGLHKSSAYAKKGWHSWYFLSS